MPARGFSPPPETGSTSVKKKAAASGDAAAPARAASSACLSPKADTKARQTAPNGSAKKAKVGESAKFFDTKARRKRKHQIRTAGRSTADEPPPSPSLLPIPTFHA